MKTIVFSLICHWLSGSSNLSYRSVSNSRDPSKLLVSSFGHDLGSQVAGGGSIFASRVGADEANFASRVRKSALEGLSSAADFKDPGFGHPIFEAENSESPRVVPTLAGFGPELEKIVQKKSMGAFAQQQDEKEIERSGLGSGGSALSKNQTVGKRL